MGWVGVTRGAGSNALPRERASDRITDYDSDSPAARLAFGPRRFPAAFAFGVGAASEALAAGSPEGEFIQDADPSVLPASPEPDGVDSAGGEMGGGTGSAAAALTGSVAGTGAWTAVGDDGPGAGMVGGGAGAGGAGAGAARAGAAAAGEGFVRMGTNSPGFHSWGA